MSRAGFTAYTPPFDDDDRNQIHAYHGRVCSNLCQILRRDGFKYLPCLNFRAKQSESEEAAKLISKLIDRTRGGLGWPDGDMGSIWMF